MLRSDGGSGSRSSATCGLSREDFGPVVMRRNQSFGFFLKPLMREDGRERRAEGIQRGDVGLSDKTSDTVPNPRERDNMRRPYGIGNPEGHSNTSIRLYLCIHHPIATGRSNPIVTASQSCPESAHSGQSRPSLPPTPRASHPSSTTPRFCPQPIPP